MTLHVCDHTPGQSWTPPAWMIPDLESPGLVVGNSHCHCQRAQICQTTNSQIRVEHKAHNLSSTVVCKAPQKKSTLWQLLTTLKSKPSILRTHTTVTKVCTVHHRISRADGRIIAQAAESVLISAA